MKPIEQARQVLRGNAATRIGHFDAERAVANSRDQLDRAGCVQSAGKIMIRVVVCLAPAIAVERFLGFLNTLNIIVAAEVT